MNTMASVPQAGYARVLERVSALLPEIEARADEIEQGQTVPLDLLDKVEATGAFRMCVPAELGGEELTFTEASYIIEQVAAADASVAWHLMVAAGSQVILSRLPLESLKTYYAAGPDVWPKAAASPKGVATRVDGGYRVSGRWPLASGARNFEWISLGFLIKDENGVRMAPNGMPDFRICLIPRGEAKIVPTWDAVGLRGTRSDDIEVHDAFIPDDWQASLFGPSQVQAPMLRISMPFATGPHHSAVVKGLLKASIRDLAKASLTRRPAFNPTMLMKDDPVFRTRFGEIAARVDAICALADRSVDILEGADREGRDVLPMEGARLAGAESLIHHEATGLMDQIMMLSGSAGIYMSNVQQRRWRDLRCVAQHQAANIGNYAQYAVALINEAAGAAEVAAT